ncbi:MAG TPA: deoxyhypusine synthase family protein [Patescibacteria group bacterium]|nr:deoxyhypusine synthase family protein [Patescibacteria group bacterium]
MEHRHPCGKPKEMELLGRPVDVWPVDDVETPEELLLHCMPAFGGAYIKRIYQILDLAIGRGVPIVMSIAGPVTVSNQHRAWLIPLLRTGWIAYITVTDAICYHDGHDSLEKFGERPIREVAIEGKDEEYGKNGVIRVTDCGFDESILFKQDQFSTAMLLQPEFQRRMNGPEFRHLVGKYYAAQEKAFGVQPGLLSTCFNLGIPVFCPSPGDGSLYLNNVKLDALRRRGIIDHKFELDIAGEVFESCAYHYWALTESEAKELAIWILGGGAVKNFSLQPEPTLSQIFLRPEIGGYGYDVQIVGAPVTDGSLTGCKGQEAHTWGKVTLEALASTVESVQADYSMVMPLIAWALLEKRRRLCAMRDKGTYTEFFAKHPEIRGYLRSSHGYRLFDRREELINQLLDVVTAPDHVEKLRETFDYPLQYRIRASQP